MNSEELKQSIKIITHTEYPELEKFEKDKKRVDSFLKSENTKKAAELFFEKLERENADRIKT